jgi:hypothetical protein
VNVGPYRGTLYVNIREFYDKDGKLAPGKKGIALTGDQWSKLKSIVDKIDAELKSAK